MEQAILLHESRGQWDKLVGWQASMTVKHSRPEKIALLQLSADEEELPADTSPSGLRPATSPQGEALSAEEGCNNCRDHVRLCSWNGVETYIEGRKLITTKDEWKYEADIRFCPVCGRKL